MKRWLVGLTCAWMGWTTAMAVNIADGTPIAEDFDSMVATNTAA